MRSCCLQPRLGCRHSALVPVKSALSSSPARPGRGRRGEGGRRAPIKHVLSRTRLWRPDSWVGPLQSAHARPQCLRGRENENEGEGSERKSIMLCLVAWGAV